MTRILVPYHLDERLPDLDVPVTPDVTVTVDLPEGDPWGRMARLYEAVAATVAETVRGGARPTVVSGDCTTSLGVVAGLQWAGLDPAIVWFDAHGDVQTLETTASGYLGGLPLSIQVGYRPELLAAAISLAPVHVDLDVVDPDDLPGLLFPTPGGPSLPAVAEAVRDVLATGRVTAFGVACTWRSGHGTGALVAPHLEAALSAG